MISKVHMREYYFRSTGTRAPGSAKIPTNTDDIDPDDDADGGLSIGAIVGIVWGSLVALGTCCYICLYLYERTSR